jgi:hypothetical protein
MTIAAADFRNCVLGPALRALVPAGIPQSLVAADLLMATAAVESALGTWLTQVAGPAKSVFQVEPATLAALLGGLTAEETRALRTVKTPQPVIDQVDGNLVLAAAVARLIYWRVAAPLPPHTAAGLWGYYKAYWNTPAGRTTEAQFLAALKLTDIRF